MWNQRHRARAQGEATPPPAATLRRILKALKSHDGPFWGNSTSPDQQSVPQQTLAFQDLLLPVVYMARRQRQERHGRDPAFVTENALCGLDRILLSRLSELFARTLFRGFVLHRLVQTPHALLYGLPVLHDPDSTCLYEDYVSKLRSGGIDELFTDNPVLADLCVRLTELWIDSTGRFLARLSADAEDIAMAFLSDTTLGNVVSVAGELSDPHLGGQTVLKITFECGLKLAYKPRDLSLDAAWTAFLDWLCQYAAPESARAPTLLLKTGYGWVEWIDSQPCTDPAAAARFFERAGSTLCLLHFLRGTDFHFENVIVSGEWPVPVDLEALFQPVPPGDTTVSASGTAERLAAKWLRDSVLSTGFLPQWLVIPGGHFMAIGGLFTEQHKLSGHRTFVNVNTDAMAYESVSVRVPNANNIVILDGVSLSARAFAKDILGGYGAMYRFLLEQRSTLLSRSGPLDAFRGSKVRVVLRPTVLYSYLLRRAIGARNLRDWLLFRDSLSVLGRVGSFATGEMRDRVVTDEIAAMCCLDIPYFTSMTDSRALGLSQGGRIDGFFPSCVLDDVAEQLRQMSEARLSESLETITEALSSNAAIVSNSYLYTVGAASPHVSATPDRADETVHDLFNTLRKSAICGNDGMTWIGSVPLAGETRNQIDAIGFDLYSGSAGIALFFAAHFKISGDENSRDAALSALGPLRNLIRASTAVEKLVRAIGIGGASGAGSLIYALTRAADLLDAPFLREDAGKIACAMTHEMIASDSIFDVIGGAAGAALGLLTLYDATGDVALLSRARACGERLVRSRKRTSTGSRAWVGLNDQALTGFSHGASGIALALSRLSLACSAEIFLEAACEAVDFEDALYCESACNWPDLRTSAAHATNYACQWCHGAPGIAMARTQLLEALDRPNEREMIDAALATTQKGAGIGPDHLCCGTFGRVDVLLTCGLRLDRSDLVDHAITLAASALNAAAIRGDFAWPHGAGRFSPGFFSGRAGVGYQLLRLKRPEVLPSILCWD